MYITCIISVVVTFLIKLYRERVVIPIQTYKKCKSLSSTFLLFYKIIILLQNRMSNYLRTVAIPTIIKKKKLNISPCRKKQFQSLICKATHTHLFFCISLARQKNILYLNHRLTKPIVFFLV